MSRPQKTVMRDHRSVYDDGLTCCTRAGDVTISCFENDLPGWIDTELDQLYQNLHSSLLHHGVRRKAAHASAYVVRKDGQAIAILLYQRDKRKVSVINEMIDISADELNRFCSYMFSRYKLVQVISFSLIGKEVDRLLFPHHQHDCSEDIVVRLPQTPENYLESLSPKMRRNIRYCLRMIARDYPGFRCETAFGEEIKESCLRDLIQLKRTNISAKNIKFGIEDHEIEWLVHEARKFTLLTVVLVDDKVCGGSISLRVHDHYFGQIICFDPAYKKYSLGILCTYLTIRDQILLGGKESHLCWGRYQYKYKLLGEQRDRASLEMYRSRAIYLRHLGLIALRTIKTGLKYWKNRLLDMEREEGNVAQVGAGLIRILRKIKRSGAVG